MPTLPRTGAFARTMIWFAESTWSNSGWNAAMPARASLTTPSARLMSFFMPCLLSAPVLTLTFNRRFGNPTQFRAASYRTSTCHEIIGEYTQHSSQERANKIDDQMRKVICATKHDLHQSRAE